MPLRDGIQPTHLAEFTIVSLERILVVTEFSDASC